ncbi:hypothetical protein [Longispora urticae]
MTTDNLKAAFLERVEALGVGVAPQATAVSPEDSAQYPTAAGLLPDDEDE